jgi:ATP-binding cassette, subfamily B, bacterial MsbA
VKNYFRLLAYVKPYLPQASLSVLFNIFSVVFSLFSLTMIVPFLNVLFAQEQYYQPAALTFSVKSLLDNFNYYLSVYVKQEGQMQALMMICVFVVVVFFLKNLTRYLGLYFIAPVRFGVVKDIRTRLYDKILNLPIGYFTEERKGDIISRMTNDVHEIEWSVMSSLEATFREPINMILFLLTLLTMSPQLTLFVFVLLPIAGFIIARIGKGLRKKSTQQQEKMGQLLSSIEETLSGLRIIHAFTAEAFQRRKFAVLNKEHNRLMNRIGRRGDLSSPMSEFLGAAVMAVVMYFGGKLVLSPDQQLTPSEFIAYIAIFSQIIAPAKAFTTAYYNIQKGLSSKERIDKILDAEVLIKESAFPVVIHEFNKKIEYRDLSFAYRKGESGYVLNNINLSVAKGSTVALVGQSGSGKTTLADLLPRFYDPSAGGIYIDDVNIRDLKISDLRKLMGVVNQESILFNDTVFNNIAFGMDDVKPDDVIQAAKIANAHDFIMDMPEQYQTNIGDRGGKLSGGQRQRLSIARAVLKNPPILILDEATSALDTESERLVQDALNALMKNRTSIVIAHRLSTILSADEIIVLQKGEIVERGTHTQLLETGKYYRKLYELQNFA